MASPLTATAGRLQRLVGHISPASFLPAAAAEPLPELSLVGKPVEAVDTPALLIELDALEHNIATYAETLAGRNCVWRPHCKAIRSPELAHKLIAAGAVGVTCAKLSQAAALADGGIRDFLIANEVVGPTKMAALTALAKRSDAVCVACDGEEQLRATSAAAAAAGVTIHVLIDVNIGMDRCGVHWERHDEILRLCQLAVSLPALTHRGLMGYDGGEAITAKATADRLHAARDFVEAAGVEVHLISGAGSENYWVASTLDKGTMWEMQGGGGVLCCQRYYDTFHEKGEGAVATHQYSVHVMAQIVSNTAQAAERRVVGDAGFKTTMWPFAQTGKGDCMPKILSPAGLTVKSLSAEHTIMDVAAGTPPLALGQRITMVPYYSDATMLLHRLAYAVRAGKVEAVWSLEGSVGRLQ